MRYLCLYFGNATQVASADLLEALASYERAQQSVRLIALRKRKNTIPKHCRQENRVVSPTWFHSPFKFYRLQGSVAWRRWAYRSTGSNIATRASFKQASNYAQLSVILTVLIFGFIQYASRFITCQRYSIASRLGE